MRLMNQDRTRLRLRLPHVTEAAPALFLFAGCRESATSNVCLSPIIRNPNFLSYYLCLCGPNIWFAPPRTLGFEDPTAFDPLQATTMTRGNQRDKAREKNLKDQSSQVGIASPYHYEGPIAIFRSPAFHSNSSADSPVPRYTCNLRYSASRSNKR